METTTQPILCCLGDCVAGKPTQFVMERAFAACETDWRVLTVEIDAADFDTVIAGIRAMRFQAVRFLSSFEERAAEHLFSQSEIATFVGGITSAALTRSEWTGWHNLGYGLREIFSRRGDWLNSICWIHGNSVRTRSFYCAAVADRLPRAILWSEPPDGILETFQTQRNQKLTRCTGSVAEIAEKLPECIDSNVSLLAVLADEIDGESALSHELAAIESAPQIIVALGESTNASSELLKNAVALSTLDEAVAAEAYDFQRWTDLQPDLFLLRDAYEEYCEF